MAQTLFKTTGVTADNADQIKDAGMDISDIKWVNVNINNDTIVVTHGDSFDEASFVDIVTNIDGNITLTN